MVDDKILKVSGDVSWIGVLDRDIVTFDVVMETKYGTTYNSYFINADKKTIVETVKEKFWETYLAKLKKVVELSEIEYIIVDHAEPDHSGCVEKLLQLAPKATVIGSGNAIRYLHDLLGFDFSNQIVKDGQVLDLGNKKLQFIGAPNLHWPDTMMTYLQENKLLFTCDIFGEHFCHDGVFDDLIPDFDDAFRYYFDVIMKPYSKYMLRAIERISQLDIQTICTGHGAILRKNWQKYVQLSKQYSEVALQKPIPNRIFVAYVSAYHNTGIIAGKIAEGIRQAGDIDIDLCDIEKMDMATLESKIIDASALVLGSPTFSQNILLPVYQVFGLINPVRDRNKLAAAFGSYGWSGEGAKIITTALRNLKLQVIDDGLMVKFTPHKEDIDQCIAYGKAFGLKLLAKDMSE